MNAYLSVSGETTCEKTIEKSRFITYVVHTADEEEAKAFLVRVREEHRLATHVCYGYIADRVGNIQRFSDDGEPQGTAGIPILNVIKARSLAETAVAVVRYFGGIKLGAGGLTRAYSSSAAEGIAAAAVREYDLCAELSVQVDYPDVNAAVRFLADFEVISREFHEKACFFVAVRSDEADGFIKRCNEYFNGKVAVAERRRYFYCFPIKNR